MNNRIVLNRIPFFAKMRSFILTLNVLICHQVIATTNLPASDDVRNTQRKTHVGGLSPNRLTEGFKELVYLEAHPHHAFDVDSLGVNVGYWPLSELDPQLAGQITSVLSKQARTSDSEQQIYSLRLDVFRRSLSEELIFTSQIPLRIGSMKFTIPVTGLVGVLIGRPRIIDPLGTVHEIWYLPEVEGEKPYAPTIFLGIHRGRQYVLESVADKTGPKFSRLRVVGNPNRIRFPKNDTLHSFARSVWDLHNFAGRIYVGGGDWINNQGPVSVWSSVVENSGSKYKFQKEITVDDESVDRFRTCAGRLVVPGIDATESWSFGNIYIRENGKWRKQRTIPNAVHVFDAAFFADKLYVTADTELGAALFESSDWGKTWRRFSHDNIDEFSDGRYIEMAALEQGLIVTPGQEYLYLFNNHILERLVIPQFPGLKKDRRIPHRVTPFLNGILYTYLRWKEEPASKPLYYLSDLKKGAVVVQQFLHDWVQDILVRDDVCYVLACHKEETVYHGYVYRSRDLQEWSKVAQFDVGALPYSLELMDGVFHVGLAALSGQANSESGNICRLLP
ncbi:MAG: hypothetical protein J4F39_09695 [Candidatus Latescibacteria bacterium]|nr:hypothetical protein [Candidatus Latescibacterota bacterium]